MTQLYVGNLSADGDEKAIRTLFSRYGVVREVLMKNGYAFVEFEDACSADTAMRDLNGEFVYYSVYAWRFAKDLYLCHFSACTGYYTWIVEWS